MRTLRQYLISTLGLMLMLGALSACSPAIRGGGDEVSPAVPEQLSSIDANAAPATPAPSGFVPGDALPTIASDATPTIVVGVTPTVITTIAGQEYRELTWEELIPPGYRSEDILAKYQVQLSDFEDGDPAAWDLYQKMQEEFNNAPVNTQLDQSSIKLPGFIAPLEYDGELITEFLLVPYFGACIHVPPPPVNQTVYVSLAEGEGITPDASYYPVWVHGYLTAEGVNTGIGEAGYQIRDAVLTPYEYPTG